MPRLEKPKYFPQSMSLSLYGELEGNGHRLRALSAQPFLNTGARRLDFSSLGFLRFLSLEFHGQKSFVPGKTSDI